MRECSSCNQPKYLNANNFKSSGPGLFQKTCITCGLKSKEGRLRRKAAKNVENQNPNVPSGTQPAQAEGEQPAGDTPEHNTADFVNLTDLSLHDFLRVLGDANKIVALTLGEVEDGSITDGDDPGWIVGNESLTGGAWRHIGIQKVLGKQRADNETEPEVSLVEPQQSSSPIEYGTADEHQMDQWCENLLTRADELEAAAKIMRAQTVPPQSYLDKKRHETTGRTRDNTWARPKNGLERCRVDNVMGYMANIPENRVPGLSSSGQE
ncbi:hypothetical protein C8J56DRAFT_906278 [Mycena floridula]|nr:hypothetical protein C8J56DRAFT_906278 [Mycena floridula]